MKQIIFIAAVIVSLFSAILTDAAFSAQIPANEVITSALETERHIWIGTTTGLWQINKRNNKTFKFTPDNSNLPSRKVKGICMGKYGQVYVATDKGILHYDNFAFLVINNENSALPSNSITSIISDKNYVVWVGTTDKGLVKMSNGKCRVHNVSNSEIASNSVAALSKDESGNVVVQCEGVQMLATNIE